MPHASRFASTHKITKVIDDVVPGTQTKIVVGSVVPATVSYTVPSAVVAKVAPAPSGARYAVIGDDVVLVSNTTHKITKIYYAVIG